MKQSAILGMAMAGLLALPFAAQASDADLQKGGCVACHAKDKKIVGPSYNDIAKKYQGQADAPEKLAAKARKGGAGVWGPVPMPPNSPEKISDSELHGAISTMLKP